MRFRITHRFFTNAKPEEFSETDAPEWLTGGKTVPGSTMDSRWFWQDHVLTLPVGGSVETDFRTIIRLANAISHPAATANAVTQQRTLSPSDEPTC